MQELKVDFHKGKHKMMHYKTPNNYIGEMQQCITSRLEEVAQKQRNSTKSIRWWHKLKPSLYLAASFVGLFLCFKSFVYIQTSLQDNNTHIADIEDSYLSYYEEYAERLVTEELESDWRE